MPLLPLTELFGDGAGTAMFASPSSMKEATSAMTRRVRRPNLDTVLKQAEKVGRPVKSVTFISDGGFTLVFADGEAALSSSNPWDAEMFATK
jgi:hypothetical protein